jgi:hypothetical protein
VLHFLKIPLSQDHLATGFIQEHHMRLYSQKDVDLKGARAARTR